MENAKSNVEGADIYNFDQRVKTLLVNKDENATTAFTVFIERHSKARNIYE